MFEFCILAPYLLQIYIYVNLTDDKSIIYWNTVFDVFMSAVQYHNNVHVQVTFENLANKTKRPCLLIGQLP